MLFAAVRGAVRFQNAAAETHGARSDLSDLMILPGGPSVKTGPFAEIRGKIKFPAAAGRNLALCLPLIY